MSSRGTGAWTSRKKFPQIPKAGPPGELGDPAPQLSQCACLLGASGAFRRECRTGGTGRDPACRPGHDSFGAPGDGRLLRRVPGAALGAAAATHTQICGAGRLEVAQHLRVADAQPAERGWRAARAVAVPTDDRGPGSWPPALGSGARGCVCGLFPGGWSRHAVEPDLGPGLGSPLSPFGGSELPQHRRSVWPLRGLLPGVSAPGAELRLLAPAEATAAFSPSSIPRLQHDQLGHSGHPGPLPFAAVRLDESLAAPAVSPGAFCSGCPWYNRTGYSGCHEHHPRGPHSDQ